MKLASYERDGAVSFGLAVDGGLVDLPNRSGRSPELGQALAEGELAELASFGGNDPDFSVESTKFLPVVPRPGKIIGVGLNYRDHAAETGKDLPSYPTLFVRFADSIVGHRAPLTCPAASHRFDYEGELAVIMGRPARHVDRARALEFVAGYTCFNDATVRDWQGHTTQFTPGKNFMGSGAMGPFLTTADEIRDPSALTLTTRFNGSVVQQASTSEMIFDVPSLIEYISAFTQLLPGDVIATGTPAGVGYRRQPRLYMKEGDVVEVEIDGIGTLSNPVVLEVVQAESQ
ncbi:MAG: fumarylacetoacetate hydrolase family protein [Alphaproteobacteria bacterium]